MESTSNIWFTVSRYSSHSFLASALDGDQWSASRPGRDLTPVATGQEPGRPRGWSGHRLQEKTFASGPSDTILTELARLIYMYIYKYTL
jgi:hypothetical protein